MKVLFNKIKRVNKIFLSIYLLVLVVLCLCYGLFIKNMLGFTNIETMLRIIIVAILGVWIFVYFLWNLVNLILKKHLTIAITTSVSVILSVILVVINYYAGIVITGIGNVTEKDFITYSSSLVILNETKIDKDSSLGIIKSDNKEQELAHNLAIELIKKEKLTDNKILEYTNYYDMVYDLLNKKIDGVFLTPNYLTSYPEEEFKGINDTKILYNYSKEMENEDKVLVKNKDLTEPFTVLLMGVDSTEDGLSSGTSFNGDTLMLITFNPQTLNATMFSIPRDTYVPIACNNNRYAKINSSAAYGTSCVKKTIEQFTGIDIDYHVKINFKGVVDLVEALGGVEVEVEKPDYKAYINEYKGKVCEQNSLRQFGDNLICIEPGVQTLNGEEALAYARCRHAYLLSDIARNKHQQQIIEAIARKIANPNNINKFSELLNAITNNIDTNMTKEQILSFYEVLKNMISKTLQDGSFLTLEKTYMEYYNLPVRLSNNGTITSAIGHYPGSLEAIVDLMKVNLGLKKKEMIKTFSFDANEEYITKPVGQGITTGEKLVTMPNFVGQTVSTVEDWAINNNIELSTEFVDNTSEYYNPTVMPGLIGYQSVKDAVLLNGVTELTIYINDGEPATPVIPNQDEEDDDEDNNGYNNSDNLFDNNTSIPDDIIDQNLQDLFP